MFAKALFVQVACALDLAMVVLSFGVLVHLKGSLTAAWGVCSQESCCVLLKLGALRLNFELIIAVESCSVLAVDSTFGVCSWSCWLGLACSRLNFEASLSFILAVEGLFVGHKGWTSGAHLCLVTKELSLITLETFSFHVGGDNSVLDTLELSANSVTWVQFALVTSIVEFSLSSIVLRCSVRYFVLEELFLSQFEGWVIFHVLGNSLHGVFWATSLPRSLVKLVVAKFVNFRIVLSTVEGCIRLHHRFLFMFRDILKSSSDWFVFSSCNAHLLSTRFSESWLGSFLCYVFFFCHTVRIVLVLKLGPSWHLIVTFERVSSTLGLRSLHEGSWLGTKDCLCVHAAWNHLLLASCHVGENTKTLSGCLSSWNVTSS